MAVRSGISALAASVISITNVTSAGQAAGVGIIAAGGTLIELILVQITINLRYSLMALSLSQRLDPSFTPAHRLFAAYGITDEIFAVCAAQPVPLTPWYMYGVILISVAGWVAGTATGGAAGEILPASVSSAMGIVLYGMFIAIVVPPARRNRSILVVAVSAAALSTLFWYVFTSVSQGFAVIISSAAAAAAGAVLFPREEGEA
ncbi:MAG: AzlC family ABC transporter permease [Ruminococcus sp.]|nr:AzlC family ABC transporter permease [Ruminococcus sp.]